MIDISALFDQKIYQDFGSATFYLARGSGSPSKLLLNQHKKIWGKLTYNASDSRIPDLYGKIHIFLFDNSECLDYTMYVYVGSIYTL